MIQLILWQFIYNTVSGLSKFLFNSAVYEYSKRNIQRTGGRFIYGLLLKIARLEYICDLKMTLVFVRQSDKTLKSLRLQQKTQ